VSDASAYETELYRFVETRRPGILNALREQKALSDELKAQVDGALKEFGAEFSAARRAA
jgi:F-type H+-transporting ATPase subunit alpha